MHSYLCWGFVWIHAAGHPKWMDGISQFSLCDGSEQFGPQTGSSRVHEVCIGNDPRQQCLSVFIPLRWIPARQLVRGCAQWPSSLLLLLLFCLFNWAHYFLDSRKISTALGLVAPRRPGHPSRWQLPWPNSRNQPINQPLHLRSWWTFWELAEHSLCLTVHSHLVHGFPGVRRVLGPPRGPGSAAPVPDVRLS